MYTYIKTRNILNSIFCQVRNIYFCPNANNDSKIVIFTKI